MNNPWDFPQGKAATMGNSATASTADGDWTVSQQNNFTSKK